MKHLVVQKKKKDQRHDTSVDDHHYDQSKEHIYEYAFSPTKENPTRVFYSICKRFSVE